MQPIKELLTPEEFRQVTQRSNWRGASIVAFDWLVIILTFVVLANYPNPVTLLVGLFVLGARQLGLGIVVHETGHQSLFASSRLNDFASKWLSGYWVFSDRKSYMKTHLKHHQAAGTSDDPDAPNYQAYPISRTSLKRKVIRDLTGQLGWRRVKSIYRGISRLNEFKPEVREYMIRSIGVNLALLAILTAFGHAWLYLVWVLAFMTSHMLVVRIRQIGEHAGVPNLLDQDPRQNTRTLYLNPLERFLIAPHQVSYHLEHHMLASVPIYRLRTLHNILLNKGYYQDVKFQHGYFSLLKNVTYA